MRFTNGGLQLVLSVAVCLPLSAQNANHVSQGSRVRVTALSLAAKPMVGWIDAVGPTTMTLVIRGDSVAVVPLHAVDRLELSVKRWNRGARVKRAAGLGGLVGMVPGLMLGFAASSNCSGEWCWRELEIFGYALLGALAGAGIGAIVGGLQPTDDWQAADLEGAGSSSVQITDQVGRR